MKKLLNYSVIFKVISFNQLIVGTGMLLRTIFAILYRESVFPFILSAGTVYLAGGIFRLLSNLWRDHSPVMKRDAFIIVLSNWILMVVSGSLPYIFSGAIPSGVDALFESV